MQQLDSNFASKREACECRIEVVQLVLQMIAVRTHILDLLELDVQRMQARTQIHLQFGEATEKIIARGGGRQRGAAGRSVAQTTRRCCGVRARVKGRAR